MFTLSSQVPQSNLGIVAHNIVHLWQAGIHSFDIAGHLAPGVHQEHSPGIHNTPIVNSLLPDVSFKLSIHT